MRIPLPVPFSNSFLQLLHSLRVSSVDPRWVLPSPLQNSLINRLDLVPMGLNILKRNLDLIRGQIKFLNDSFQGACLVHVIQNTINRDARPFYLRASATFDDSSR